MNTERFEPVTKTFMSMRIRAKKMLRVSFTLGLSTRDAYRLFRSYDMDIVFLAGLMRFRVDKCGDSPKLQRTHYLWHVYACVAC